MLLYSDTLVRNAVHCDDRIHHEVAGERTFKPVQGRSEGGVTGHYVRKLKLKIIIQFEKILNF